MESKAVEITREKDVAIAAFQGSSLSNPQEVADVSAKLLAYISEHKPATLIVDFEPVKFFSSQVLGVLINTRAKLKEYGGQVFVCGINPQLYRVFRITNLDKIFKFYPTRDVALKDAGIE